MMMAERAADCLAKLGLDTTTITTSTAASTTTSSSSSSTTTSANVNGSLGLVDINDHQLSPIANGHYGHHRRSRSLRERTGVDARLERLPSGPAAGHRVSLSPLFTIIPGVNLEQR